MTVGFLAHFVMKRATDRVLLLQLHELHELWKGTFIQSFNHAFQKTSSAPKIFQIIILVHASCHKDLAIWRSDENQRLCHTSKWLPNCCLNYIQRPFPKKIDNGSSFLCILIHESFLETSREVSWFATINICVRAVWRRKIRFWRTRPEHVYNKDLFHVTEELKATHCIRSKIQVSSQMLL